MPSRTTFPKTLTDLVRDPEKFRKAMTLLETLERAEVVANNGKRIPLKVSETNALFDLRDVQNQAPVTEEPANFLHPETALWKARAEANLGTFSENSVDIADALIRAINAATFNSKIVWLLPMLGANNKAACIPLRDTLNKGIAGWADSPVTYAENQGFYQSALGVAIDTDIKVSDLTAGSDTWGIGYWERGWTANAPDLAFIAYNSDGNAQGGLQMQPAGVNFYSATETFNRYVYGATSQNAHHYGQAQVGTLSIFADGAMTASSSSLAITDPAFTERALKIHTSEYGFTYKGRCAVAYLTDGTLTAAEIAALHSLLNTYLIAPTGR